MSLYHIKSSPRGVTLDITCNPNGSEDDSCCKTL